MAQVPLWKDVTRSHARTPAAETMIDVRHLRVLVAVAELGNVSAAARALGLAQSTVSESIAALERAVGARTVQRVRGAHRVALTSVGQVLLPHARHVLGSLRDARLDIARATRTANHRIEIITCESVATYLLSASLRPLRAEWSNTTFAVSIGSCHEVRTAVLNSTHQLGLLLEAEEEKCRQPCSAVLSESDRFGTDLVQTNMPFVFVVAAGHPARASGQRRPVPRRDLAAYPVVISDADGELPRWVDRYFAPDGLPRPRIDAAGTIEGVKRAVLAAGDAIGVLPQYAIAEDRRLGVVHVLPSDPSLPSLRLLALRDRSAPEHPAIAQLICALRDGIAQSSIPMRAARRA